MEFVLEENRRNPEKTYPGPFVHHETHVEWSELGTPAKGGERLDASAEGPPCRMKMIDNFSNICYIEWAWHYFYQKSTGYRYHGSLQDNSLLD